MKKLAVLFLLTIFVGSFTFAIEGIGDFTAALDFEIEDLADNDAKTDPLAIGIEPSITYSRAFGALGLEAGLGDKLTISLGDSDVYESTIGDSLYLWVKPSYSLAAGPGTLGFDLKIKPTFYLAQPERKGEDRDLPGPSFAIDPHVGYGLDAGFGTLAFDLGTDSLIIHEGGGGYDSDGGKYGLGFIPIYFQAGVALPIGFNAYLKPYFGIATSDEAVGENDYHNSEFSKIVIGLGYQIIEIVRADLDVTIPIGTKDNGTDLEVVGLTIAPKVTAAFGAIGAYLGAEISRIAADVDSIGFKLNLGASYSF
jgi:hypothetical protein